MLSSNTTQVSSDRLYVEDVFSTYLYNGNGSTQTINNGIDLAGKGGMVWVKVRNGIFSHILVDTNRGINQGLSTDTSTGSQNYSGNQIVNGFLSNGFTVGPNGLTNASSSPAYSYASWTFRKAPKFFDVVTWTGNGVSGREIAHNLGVAPGCIIIKSTTSGDDWIVYHRGMNGGTNPQDYGMYLNFTYAQTVVQWFNYSAPTASSFRVSADGVCNSAGITYVAYLFAHDPTADGIIQCGSYTGNGNDSGPSINLGWEPQWVLIKKATNNNGGLRSWVIADNMRGMPAFPSNDGNILAPNTSGAELANCAIRPNSTGFSLGLGDAYNGSGETYVYIAIRRGPMKTPTVGTSVFLPAIRTGTGATAIVTSTSFPPDVIATGGRSPGRGFQWYDKLRGAKNLLRAASAAIEDTTLTDECISINQNGMTLGSSGTQGFLNFSGESKIDYFWKRASGFFDEVCYTGTGIARTVNHNLSVAPELIITKGRSAAEDWFVWSSGLTTSQYLLLSTSDAKTGGSNNWNSTAPTSTVFSLGATGNTNGSGVNYVAYLFASCPGVSKVGSYTGNGSSQTINCGFATGARFVMIKRTDSTGDWYVWDTARGIVAGNDPHLSMNTTATEVTGDDTIDPNSSGFIVNQVAATNVNVNAATYIYLAIA